MWFYKFLFVDFGFCFEIKLYMIILMLNDLEIIKWILLLVCLIIFVIYNFFFEF